MTTYPLPTLACTVTAIGITAPSYADIFASLQASYQAIYGADVNLDDDTQDGEWLAVIAQAIHDCNDATIAAYQNQSPATAQGSGLSANVKINGLKRDIPTNSTAPILCTGVAGTIISNGLVGDGVNQWALPATVTIPPGGSITETATCQTAGAITAPSGTIDLILTPTRNWQSAVSSGDAAPGAPVEDDAQLRQRQSLSTALPAQTIIEGIYGAIANITGVQQLKIYENDTSATDANTVPPHSIAVVVEGGDAVAIANAIALKKDPGCGTYGTTSELVIDSKGMPNTIRFFIPTQVPIAVTVVLKAQTGYVSTTGTLIQTQIAAYLAVLGIGSSDQFVFNSKLYSPADDTGALANTYNVTSITMSRDGHALTPSDIPIAFNELPTAGTITITVS